MKKLILLYVNQILNFAKAGAVLAVVVFTLPGTVLAQADTVKKLKQVDINSKPIPQVQTVTPSQQITAADFKRYNALTVADALRDFSGVNIKDYGGIGGLKTVSVRSLSANHLAVLYDGVAMNDAQNGQIDLGKLNLNNVQSITLYNGQPTDICQPARSFASASVLVINTVRPMLDSVKPYQIQLGINGGSFGLVNPSVQWQQRVNKCWSFIVNSYIEKADGKYKYKNDQDGSDTLANRVNGDVDTKQADAALYWAKSDSNKLNIHINYYNGDRGLPSATANYNPYAVARLQNLDYFMQAGYDRIWNSGLHLLINSKISQNYIRYTDPNFLNGKGGLDTRYTQYEFYQSAALAYNIAPNWQVSYSADVAYTKLDANLPDYLYPNRVTLLNVLASNFTIGKLLIQGSVLATNITERVNAGNSAPTVSNLKPTIIASYRPTKNLQLRAFYKDVFRQPTFDEQYFFAVVNIRNIKPEYAKQYDAGFTYSQAFNGVLSYVTLTADGYYNDVTNKIVSMPSQNLAISSVVNLGQVNIKGADIGLKTQLNIINQWKAVLSANYTWQQALDVDDPANTFQIPYAPQSLLAINGGVYNNHFGLYVNHIYTSPRYYANDNAIEHKVKSFDVTDVTGSYSFMAKGKPISVSAGVNNLFDHRYEIVRSFPMPGLSVRFTLQITI